VTALQPVWPLTRRPERPGVGVEGHRGRVTAASFTADGGLLVSADQSGQTLVSDARTGRVLHSVPGRELFCPVATLATSPRQEVAIGMADGTVHIIEIGDEVRERAVLVHDGWRESVEDLLFLRDGRCLLIRRRDRFQVLDLDHERVLVDVTLEDMRFGRAPWTVSDDALVVGAGGDVRTYPLDDPGSGWVRRGHTAPVDDLDVLPGVLISTDAVGIVRTWDAASGRALGAFRSVGAPAVDAQGGRLVLPTAAGARVVDPSQGDPAHEVDRYARQARRRERAADRLLALADRLPVGADALRDRADAMATTVFGRRASAGPGLGWTVVVDNDEEVTGNLVTTSYTLLFVDGTGHHVDTVRLPGRCAGVVASGPDQCATLTDDGHLYVWSAAGDARSTMEVIGGHVTAVASAPGGGRIAVGGHDGDLRLVDLTALPQQEPYEPRAEAARELVVDPEGRWAATALPDRVVAVWDLADGGLRHVFRGHVTGVFRSTETNRLAHGRDEQGDWLAHADDDGTLRVRDPVTGARVAIGAGEGGEFLGGAGARGPAVAERDGRVRLRDPRSGRIGAELIGHTDPVRSIGVTSTGLLVTAAADGVRVWDVTRPAARYTSTAHTQIGLGAHVRIDPHGRWFAAIGLRSVRLHETTGRLITEVDLPCPTTADAVAPNGDMMLVGGLDGTLTVCTPATGAVTILPSAGADAITACAVAPDGELVATGQERGAISLWDLAGGAPVAQVDVGAAITRCRWLSRTRLLTAGTTGLNLIEIR
jgi:WD40 repeat protein